jgi:phage-related protein (TIGR01555 family)
MPVSDYKLSHRAALAEAGYRHRPPMKVDIAAVARAKRKSSSPLAVSPEQTYAPYKPMPGVLPAVKGKEMALDSCLPGNFAGMTSWAVGSTQGAFHEGMAFFGYPYLAELTQRAEYRHAAEIWAEHAVRKWIKITGGTDDKRKKIEEEFDRLDVRSRFYQLAYQDNVFGRAQIFLDFGDADNEREVKTRLAVTPNKIKPARPLQSLNVVEPMWSYPAAYATSNPLRSDFYKPVGWFVYGKTVDDSRVLTVISRPVPTMLKPAYSFGGLSLTQMLKPYVDNWLRARQSTSDMLNSYSTMVLGTDMASTMNGGSGGDLYNRVDMFNETRDNRGTMVIDKDGETLENVAVPLSTTDKLLAQAQEQLASAARIPLSIYLQITPTGLNATSDGETRNFYADVHGYQEKNFGPHLSTLLDIVQLSLFGEIDPTVKYEFLPLWEMSDKDKADIRKSDAEADATYINAGVVDAEEARERLQNDETSLYHGVDLSGPPPTLEDDPEEGDLSKPPAE